MAQLEVPAALPEDLCLVTSAHIRHIKITYDSSPRDPAPSLASMGSFIHMAYMNTNTHTNIKENIHFKNLAS